jgi:hypothetical protein
MRERCVCVCVYVVDYGRSDAIMSVASRPLNSRTHMLLGEYWGGGAKMNSRRRKK